MYFNIWPHCTVSSNTLSLSYIPLILPVGLSAHVQMLVSHVGTCPPEHCSCMHVVVSVPVQNSPAATAATNFLLDQSHVIFCLNNHMSLITEQYQC